MTPILIAGIGNILMGDDGFGIEVARQLASRFAFHKNVSVVDFGIRGFDLALALSNGPPPVAILIDAAQRGNPPGTVTVLDPHGEADSASRKPWLATQFPEEPGPGPRKPWLATQFPEEPDVASREPWLAKQFSEGASAPGEALLATQFSGRGSSPGEPWLATQFSEGVARASDGPAPADTHGMHPVRALALAQSMGGVPPQIRIVVCEPHTLGTEDEPVMGLSSIVANAIPNAIAVIDALIEELSAARGHQSEVIADA